MEVQDTDVLLTHPMDLDQAEWDSHFYSPKPFHTFGIQKQNTMSRLKLKFLFASFSCTAVIMLLAFFDEPAVLFHSVWAELVVVSLMFAGAILFLTAALSKEE